MATVGREIELARIEALLDEGRAGALGVLVVQGEAGIGKSHLVREVVARAKERGMAAGLGRFFDEALDEGLAAWREAMALLGGGESGAEPGLSAARMVAREVERVRERCAHGAVLLAFDDVQWADADTIVILRQLLRRPQGVRGLVLLARRTPDALAPGVAELIAEAVRGAGIVVLEGLGRAATQAFLEGLSARRIPEGLASSLRQETLGNPLFMREAMRHLIERGAVFERDDGLRVSASLSELGVPPGVTSIIEPRVARLGEARGVIELLAARVDGASVALLARAAGKPEGALLEALSAAQRAGLIEVHSAATGQQARFPHELVRRAVWDGLVPSARAEMHRRLAEGLLALAAYGEVSAAEIALHFRGAASGAEKGVPHALEAARRAGAAGAVEARVGFARLAKTLADQAARTGGDGANAWVARAAVEVARAEVQALDLVNAPASAWTALEKMAAAGAEPAEQAAWLAEIARELKLAGMPALHWRPMAERGLAVLGPGATGIVADRLAVLFDALQPLITGRANVAMWIGSDTTVVRRLREEGDEHDFALTVDTHDRRTAAESDALSARARTFGEPLAALRVLDATARDVMFRDGDMARAFALGEEIRERAARVGSIRYEVAAGVIITCTAACIGRIDTARAALTSAAEAAARLGQRHRLHQIGPLASRLVLAYVEAAPIETWRTLAEGLDAIVRDAATLEAPFGNVALQLAVVAFAMAGDAEAARELSRLAMQAARALPRAYAEAGAMRDCLMLGAWETDAPELARELLAEPWPSSRGERASFSCAALGEVRLRGLIAHHERRLAAEAVEIARSFVAARAELEQASQHAIAAIAYVDEARLFVCDAATRDRALAAVDEALQGFERLGMRGWSARAQALRASIEEARRSVVTLPGGLTTREAELLGWLAGGLANKEIAAKLFISVATVERHVANIYDKIGCRSRAAATAWALGHGIGRPPG